MFSQTILTASEERLATLIWRVAPINSMELVALALDELNWQKSTTYTVLRKLCGKGVFRNENATVSANLTRDELLTRNSRKYVEDTFGGSLPRFITSFFGGKELTEEQITELSRMIDEFETGASGVDGDSNG